jgi:hypothetical protein
MLAEQKRGEKEPRIRPPPAPAGFSGASGQARPGQDPRRGGLYSAGIPGNAGGGYPGVLQGPGRKQAAGLYAALDACPKTGIPA